jgi:hypothetical protein
MLRNNLVRKNVNQSLLEMNAEIVDSIIIELYLWSTTSCYDLESHEIL